MREFLNLIPVIGWLINAVISFLLAIPFTILWNWLAPDYFFWLPDVYLNIPFFKVACLLYLIGMIKDNIIPSFVRVSTSSESR